eukprot:7318657-Lingulodinium_polyedra.AAC.1
MNVEPQPLQPSSAVKGSEVRRQRGCSDSLDLRLMHEPHSPHDDVVGCVHRPKGRAPAALREEAPQDGRLGRSGT